MTTFLVYSKRLVRSEVYDNTDDLAKGLAEIVRELDAKGGDFVLSIDKDEKGNLKPEFRERANRIGKEWSQ